jgi:hypothetical protein
VHKICSRKDCVVRAKAFKGVHGRADSDQAASQLLVGDGSRN